MKNVCSAATVPQKLAPDPFLILVIAQSSQCMQETLLIFLFSFDAF